MMAKSVSEIWPGLGDAGPQMYLRYTTKHFLNLHKSCGIVAKWPRDGGKREGQITLRDKSGDKRNGVRWTHTVGDTAVITIAENLTRPSRAPPPVGRGRRGEGPPKTRSR